jgi:hypothetical protein
VPLGAVLGANENSIIFKRRFIFSIYELSDCHALAKIHFGTAHSISISMQILVMINSYCALFKL